MTEDEYNRATSEEGVDPLRDEEKTCPWCGGPCQERPESSFDFRPYCSGPCALYAERDSEEDYEQPDNDEREWAV